MEFLKNLFSKKTENSSKLALDGEVFRMQGKYKKALENFNKAITIEPNNDMFYASRSAAKKGLKDFQGALKDIEKAIELKPTVNAYKKAHKELERFL